LYSETLNLREGPMRDFDLGIGLLQSSLLLGSFIGVLWMLSWKCGLSDDLYECKLKLLVG
jgi:hypothetical protein